MAFEKMSQPEATHERPSEDEIKQRALDTVRDLEKVRPDERLLERRRVQQIVDEIGLIIREKRGEQGADSQDFASFYPGYEAEDLEELADLLNERIAQLEMDIEKDSE